MENLHKQDLTKEKLKEVDTLLWEGGKGTAIRKFEVDNNFRKYLEKLYSRLVHYKYYQAEGLTIGSESVESSVRQIKDRTGISGARWSEHGAKRKY